MEKELKGDAWTICQNEFCRKMFKLIDFYDRQEPMPEVELCCCDECKAIYRAHESSNGKVV